MADTDHAGAPAAAAATRVGKPLTKRESGLLDYLRLKSTKTASEVIRSLAEKGYVALPDSGSLPARGIRILGVDLTIRRTLVPPGAAAGTGTSRPADE